MRYLARWKPRVKRTVLSVARSGDLGAGADEQPAIDQTCRAGSSLSVLGQIAVQCQGVDDFLLVVPRGSIAVAPIALAMLCKAVFAPCGDQSSTTTCSPATSTVTGLPFQTRGDPSKDFSPNTEPLLTLRK